MTPRYPIPAHLPTNWKRVDTIAKYRKDHTEVEAWRLANKELNMECDHPPGFLVHESNKFFCRICEKYITL